ncbi:tyrosine kinase receptor Cad96Ca-like isoform X1 [Cydia pomonella]|uniref:tyrosine kinase receptor Cad96Ca-like isoform X1 n=1 Tax=Cydia pomonella TaxID=82600 RepID=UPI002ADE5B3F|nr:tyrosine kinase receptor Cad96Ca-like isoform X1 [Cydia pomonella]XP_061710910.1 tyrosine kinase receptor Cad96Ca-like isoform X1 [Cydia pomonella]XP_061710911.1 tyrosine kinase receptor Cad96Ca-like isoform X1 [Cydia pomonella]
MLTKTLWIFLTGCFAFGSPQILDLQNLQNLLQVPRLWYARTTDPKGTEVARAFMAATGDQAVNYYLDTRGPPAPFAINSRTGVVTVNDTLIDKENRSYSLWVYADDGVLPKKLEILASITDASGKQNKVGHPPPFPPNFPEIFTAPPLKPIQRPTKVTEEVFEETTVPDITTTTATSVQTTVKIEERNETHKYNIIKDINDPTESPDANNNDVSFATIIPLIAIGGLVLIVVAVIIFVWKRNHGQKEPSKKEDMSKDSTGIVLQEPTVNLWDRPRAYSNRYEAWDNGHLQLSEETTITKDEPSDEWEFPRHRLRIFNIVGEGAFGQVWRAQAIDIDGKKGEQTVAVKTLKENASEKEKTDLVQELIVMKNLGTHPNVVRLIGCCTEKEPTLVIMEFVSLGKLQQFLRDSRAERHYGNTHAGSQFLTSRDLTHFAYQVARGMDFLSSKGIIHRDLAARNVLITEERMCKVADFGFARDVAGTHVYERKSDGRLPIRWMAPESLYDDIFSVKSDIWSFGVLLWEIVTLGSTPYPGLSAGDVMRKVREGHRLEKPEHCRRELYNIMYYCWEAEASSRPDFKEVVSMLERLLCTETDYIELERFPDHSYYNVQHLDGEKL